MASFKLSETTRKGHLLLGKIISNITGLTFTRIQAGDGHYNGDIWELTSLVSPRLDGRIVGVKPQKGIATIRCMLNNASLTEFLDFREVGVFAHDPDEGEILFAYANAGERSEYIWPFDGTLAEIDFTIEVRTANVANINAIISIATFASEIEYDNEKSLLNAVNVQGAIDELACSYKLDTLFAHNLNTYPNVLAIEHEYGYGIGGYGEAPYGGTISKQIRSMAEYLDLNKIKISLEKEYNPIDIITKVNQNEYVLTFKDSTLSLCILLFTDSGISTGGGTGSGILPGPEYIATNEEIRIILNDAFGQQP